jgi:hypothetical protein
LPFPPAVYASPRPWGRQDRIKSYERWYSERLGQEIGVARWGTLGMPVLVFPTAGGDAEEIERHGLIGACGPLLADGPGEAVRRPAAFAMPLPDFVC